MWVLLFFINNSEFCNLLGFGPKGCFFFATDIIKIVEILIIGNFLNKMEDFQGGKQLQFRDGNVAWAKESADRVCTENKQLIERLEKSVGVRILSMFKAGGFNVLLERDDDKYKIVVFSDPSGYVDLVDIGDDDAAKMKFWEMIADNTIGPFKDVGDFDQIVINIEKYFYRYCFHVN